MCNIWREMNCEMQYYGLANLAFWIMENWAKVVPSLYILILYYVVWYVWFFSKFTYRFPDLCCIFKYS